MSDEEQRRDFDERAQLTGASKIKELRDAAAPIGKRPNWVGRLNDRQLAEVYHRLKIGQPSYRIAKICQQEWGILPGSDLKSMSRAVRAFKLSVLKPLELEHAANKNQFKADNDRRHQARQISKRAERIIKDLDGLGRYRWLIEVQTERVAALREREKNALPFEITNRTIDSLAKLLNDYMRLQIDLGILDSKPSEVNLNIKGRFDGLMQHTVQGGQSVITAADKWLEACEQAALTLMLDEKGQYQLVHEEKADVCRQEGDPA